MDLNLHMKMGVNHLNRVLGYAPMVEEGGRATVHLTREDWHVVADTLFQMNTPREQLPQAIRDFRLTNDNRTIELQTDEMVIEVEVM